MHRHDLLRLFAAAAGALPFVPESLDAAIEIGRRSHERGRFAAPHGILDPEQARLVAFLADAMLARAPAPGAREVDVTGFIGHLLGEWYDWDDAQRFLAGLAALDDRARERHGESLAGLSADRRNALLDLVEREEGTSGAPPASWLRFKALVTYACLTSEQVMNATTEDPLALDLAP